jgi:general secretion pathway protein B
MSFILDALRKSEQERQRSEHPGVAHVRVQSAPGFKRTWIFLVAALVIFNLILLAFILLREAPAPPAAATQPATVTQPAAGSTPLISPPSTGAANAERAPIAIPPQAQDDSQSRDLRNELSAQAKATAAPKPSASPPASAAKPVPDKPASGPKETSSFSSLATFTELSLAGSISLPPLHLDIHVYSEKPAERFVFINMRKYREGEKLSEGPTINTITDEGVVLRHQGRDFLLKRQ